MWRTSTWHWEDVKKKFRLDSSSCFCSDLSDAREQETHCLDDMFLFNDNAEYRAGFWQSGFLENPADCPKYLVVHVERELSFWKSTLSEVSKGGIGCHQRYSYLRVKNDPVFLELFRNGQWTEASAKHSLFFLGFRVYPKNRAGLMDPCTSTPCLMLSFEMHSRRLLPNL